MAAVSRDETRPTLTGVLVEVDGSLLRLVATDTHRLSRREVAANITGDVPEGLKAGGGSRTILHGRFASELVRRLGDAARADGEDLQAVELAFGVGLPQAEARDIPLPTGGAVTLSTRLIEGQFPDYQKVIPEGALAQVSVDAEAFAEAVDRMLLVAREDANRVELSWNDAGDGRLHLTAEAPGIGDMTDSVPAEVVWAEENDGAFEASFNARYLLDGLLALEGEVVIEVGGPLNPAALTGGGGGEGGIYVLMPMQK